MGSLLQQLANNEAILLMYVADELPPADRSEVDQFLLAHSERVEQHEAIVLATQQIGEEGG